MNNKRIGVLVTFRFETEFNETAVRKIAEGARSKFEGMPGLRCKIFTVDPEAREATNFYVWESMEAAKAFFNDQLLERVAHLYGVRPSLRYVEIVESYKTGRCRNLENTRRLTRRCSPECFLGSPYSR